MPTIADRASLGPSLPDVSLPDADGAEHHLHAVAAGRPLLVAFVCNHCPYVQHVEVALGALIAGYGARLATVGVMSNDVDAYPQDGPDGMREQASRASWSFPTLVDDDHVLALALGAACTPDLFLFDAAGALVHRGAFDDSTPGNGLPVTGEHLRAALDAVLDGAPVPVGLPPSLGCSIKWRPGFAPA
jgi:peroxiredoxin